VSDWVYDLLTGTTTTAVACGFAASAEREGQRVTADYQTYLGRSPSAAEVNSWVSDFLGGLSNEDVIAGFVGSDEYFGRHGGDAADWLEAAYQDILLGSQHVNPGLGRVPLHLS
jgi:hypothetical protein